MYKRLNFEDYFTICSQNWNHLETDLQLAQYESITYKRKRKIYSVDFQVRFDNVRNCIQCIFEQTASKSDWRANFTFPHKIYDEFTFEGKVIQLKVHRGWGDMWLACQDAVRNDVKMYLSIYKDATIEVFGWSLGSALAQLCAEDIYFKFGIKPYLYTYGSVKPFYGKETYKYVQHCCEEAYNANFRHSLYFSPEQFKKINEDECVMFMTFDNKILVDPTGRTYLTEINELFLANKIKSEITFNENEYVEANGWGDYKYIEFDRLKSSTK